MSARSFHPGAKSKLPCARQLYRMASAQEAVPEDWKPNRCRSCGRRIPHTCARSGSPRLWCSNRCYQTACRRRQGVAPLANPASPNSKLAPYRGEERELLPEEKRHV